MIYTENYLTPVFVLRLINVLNLAVRCDCPTDDAHTQTPGTLGYRGLEIICTFYTLLDLILQNFAMCEVRFNVCMKMNNNFQHTESYVYQLQEPCQQGQHLNFGESYLVCILIT